MSMGGFHFLAKLVPFYWKRPKATQPTKWIRPELIGDPFFSAFFRGGR